MSSSRTQSRGTTHSVSLHNSGELFTPEFDQEVTPGSFNDDAMIRGIVTDTIKRCGRSREQIVDQMTTLLGDKVTIRSLNSYTSEAAEQHRWPAQYTRAFCHATGDWRLLRCIAERSGLHLISKSERQMFELGRQLLIQKRATVEIERLERELEGVALV